MYTSKKGRNFPEKTRFSHQKNEDEQFYKCLVKILKKKPTDCEWAITKALWSEHCSYKSSKYYLNRLPSDSPNVICGPGENAGVIDIGDGLACIFKVESHNHPSFAHPYHGAATGVGGILRDVFSMGAHPIALLNALFIGPLESERVRNTLKGIVSGISAYGNCFGVPTLGGLTTFDAPYAQNPLVNVMAVGIAPHSKLLKSAASGQGNLILYIGQGTTRSGLHGATQSSSHFLEHNPGTGKESPHIGDPLMGQCVFRALQDLHQENIIIAAQDMGAAGLACASLEMAHRGNMGFVINLDCVPQAEKHMDPESLLLSETQERLLLIIRTNAYERASELLTKWEVPHACIGYLTEAPLARFQYDGNFVAQIPFKDFYKATPLYQRSATLPQRKFPNATGFVPHPLPIQDALKRIFITLNGQSKQWIYEQYDRFVQGNTVAASPHPAALVRLPNSLKGLACTLSVTPRYCAADPFEGAQQAVAESFRNIIALGAQPQAITNCLNFGSPENEKVMGQFLATIEGLRAASLALDLPIISGNVSFYNQTAEKPIPPTPTIGCVGLLENIAYSTTTKLKAPGEIIFLVGHTQGWLYQSLYAHTIFNETSGSPPPIDFNAERAAAQFVHSLIQRRLITTVKSCGEGGLLVALAKMALMSLENTEPCGFRLDASLWDLQRSHSCLTAFLFGEDQGRYIITATPHRIAHIEQEARRQSIPLIPLGYTGGEHIITPHETGVHLRELYEIYHAFPLEH
jgi:phosphoribosylformylglycinamidine synthase